MKIKEIPYQEPHEVFVQFANESGSILLESAKTENNVGRYSFIAIDPFLMITSKNGKTKLNNDTVFQTPFEMLDLYLKKFSVSKQEDIPPFQGGFAGFIGYDAHHFFESIQVEAEDHKQFLDVALGCYDVVVSFDHLQKRSWICSTGLPEAGVEQTKKAEQRLQWMLNTLLEKNKSIHFSVISSENIQSNFTKETYCEMVKTVKDYILAGEIFQANVSQCFSLKKPDQLSAYECYCRLRQINAAPFSAFLNVESYQLISASPERFLRLSQKNIETRPIKGTRQRYSCEEQDKKISEELLRSEKDRSENIMIVDLLRNDLSKVCKPGSVKVPVLCGLESYATVHHLVSVVTGELSEEKTAVDLLQAAFPGGSVTGAPKIRAMEIIAELEKTKRGPYCGSIGYIGFNGEMDTSIVIRTIAIKDDEMTFQAGGAIVADSDPRAEYQETLTKAAALMRVFSCDFTN